MSSADVFTKINREYYQLTGAERKIADHIMLQRQECQFMSISELAEAAEVAAAVIQAAATQIMQSLLAEVRAALVL